MHYSLLSRFYLLFKLSIIRLAFRDDWRTQVFLDSFYATDITRKTTGTRFIQTKGKFREHQVLRVVHTIEEDEDNMPVFLYSHENSIAPRDSFYGSFCPVRRKVTFEKIPISQFLQHRLLCLQEEEVFLSINHL
jgi:hypothetical protein